MTQPGIEPRSPGPLANTLPTRPKPAHWPSGESVCQWSGRPGLNPRLRHTKEFKNDIYTSLLNTQQYKVRIKGKVEQSRERSSALPLHLGVVAIEKGAFWSPSTTVANNYLLVINFSAFFFNKVT